MNELKLTKAKLFPILIDNVREYIYRDKRYDTNFAIAAIYVANGIKVDVKELKDRLRETDKIVELCNQTFCVIFDNISDDSYTKAIENFNIILKNIDYKDKFFIGAVTSQDYNHDYLSMSNQLFERLDYAIKNKLYSIVIAQDYIV